MKTPTKLPSPRTPKAKTVLRFAACWLMVAGCVSERNEIPRQELYSVYVDTVRGHALMDDSPGNPLHWETATLEEWHSNYSVVFVDADFVSYRCEEYSYTGGAHGMLEVHVGTLDRKTGRKLVLDDAFPEEMRESLKAELRAKALEALGEQPILFDGLLTDNFCLMEDGWHFVYSPYEIASYAAGVVELVIPPVPLRSCHGRETTVFPFPGRFGRIKSDS